MASAQSDTAQSDTAQSSTSQSNSENTTLLTTALTQAHEQAGARMVPFAGYSMPVQYPTGIIAEHKWTRESAGLFDVSHMGQAHLEGPDASRLLESLVPADIQSLGEGRTRYTQLLNDQGGILDDLMVTKRSPSPDRAAKGEECLVLVVNAARKAQDFALIREKLPQLDLTILDDRALLALQGPKAVDVLADHWPSLRDQPFMSFGTTEPPGYFGMGFYFWRSGYTGEDGFEISVDNEIAASWFDKLCADPRVKPIGLGARDSLRLEAGLCLYGHDIDKTTSPIEANLQWSIQKRRREEGGFPGAARIQRELKDGPARRRIGLLLEGRQPAREGAEIATVDGRIIGTVTSGGPSPVLGCPIAMGYVETPHAGKGTPLHVMVRGKPLAARVVPMPFVPSRYYKS
ncbi:MAG: glycine cleavage system aminomethyltransferase GcvT [Beijerinckiaceae bacterium]|jgi:aminomethyltransferase|nr:glycine cleavage system aminomethyltransferase GcvT [Beijerinckiaceae bacterium]